MNRVYVPRSVGYGASSITMHLRPAAVVIFAILVAVFFGLASSVLPWFVIIPLVILPLAVFTIWVIPETAIVFFLLAAFGVAPEYLLPRIPVGGGVLRAEDLGILTIPLILLLRRLKDSSKLLAPMRPYVLPIGAFIFAAILSAVYAVLYLGTEAKNVLQEARPFAYWLLLPTLFLAIPDQRRLRRFLIGLLILAVITSALLLFQAITGIPVMTKGQFADELYTVQDVIRGINKTTTPAIFVVVAMFLFILAHYSSRGRFLFGPLSALFALLLVAGIVVGFQRGVWFAAIIGVLLLVFFVRNVRIIGVSLFLVFVGGLLVVVATLTRPGYVEATIDRALSIGSEIRYGTSFDRRREENRHALSSLAQKPIAGVGLGGDYMPMNLETLSWEAGRRYIHNTYLGVYLKLGALGLVAFLWLISVVLWRVFRDLRADSPDFALRFACAWAVLATLVLTAFTQPNIISTYGVLTVCLGVFLSEAIRALPGSTAAI